MPHDWDLHYSVAANVNATADPLLVQVAELCPPGEALDVACGPGHNTLYLAALGWRVTAVDGSRVAIEILRRRAAGLRIDAQIADLENGRYTIRPDAYDLIADFYFLHRALFSQIRGGVRPGGIVVAAIHLLDEQAAGGPHNPAFLLRPGELRQTFADWKILFYSEAREGPAGSGRRSAARIIARRA